MRSDQKTQQPILTQTLFSTSHIASRSWRSHATSMVLHGLMILAALLIAVPVMRRQVKKESDFTLIAPVLPEYKPKIIPPRHLPSPVVSARNEVRPKIAPQPKFTEPKPLETPKPKIVAAAPEIKIAAPEPTQSVPQPPLPTQIAPAPKPAVKTGSFETADAARSVATPKVTKVGGFGDPNGVPPSQNSRPSAATMAQVGSFDLPEGGGHTGGGGRNSSGGVRQTTFGGAGEAGGAPNGTGRGPGKVQTGAFGEPPTAVASNAPTNHPKPVQPALTPVEILSKPKPTYSEEARSMRLEGEVSLDVVFQATGSVRIIRVVHGLGHGLDEAAQQAAMRVHFRPATRDGVPVDSQATIHITFQLT
jgi:TonB family protein